jgi:hypothetical protein
LKGFLSLFIRNARRSRDGIETRVYTKRKQDFDEYELDDELVLSGFDVDRALQYCADKVIVEDGHLQEVEDLMAKLYQYRQHYIRKEKPSLSELLQKFPKIVERPHLVSFSY